MKFGNYHRIKCYISTKIKNHPKYINKVTTLKKYFLTLRYGKNQEYTYCRLGTVPGWIPEYDHRQDPMGPYYS